MPLFFPFQEEYSLNEELLTLLNMLATRSDAEPFREPVDMEEFPVGEFL